MLKSLSIPPEQVPFEILEINIDPFFGYAQFPCDVAADFIRHFRTAVSGQADALKPHEGRGFVAAAEYQ
jgi:hypothetical protein